VDQHRTECERGHPEDARSGEFEEGRRGWKRCACLIHVSGTLGGKFNRKHTGKSEWDEAKTLVAAWQTAQSREGETTPLPQPDLPPGPARMTIVAAAGAYLSNREGAKIANATLRKYKTFIKPLTDFAETRGYLMLDQFTVGDIDVFYGGLKLGAARRQSGWPRSEVFFPFA
jgi:hypothetical protein